MSSTLTRDALFRRSSTAIMGCVTSKFPSFLAKWLRSPCWCGPVSCGRLGTGSSGQVKLASLETSQREQVEREAEIYQRLVIGAQGTALERRYEQAAAELGVSPRTVRRRVDLWESQGPAGLVDDRRIAARPAGQFAVWDEACVEVLESMTYRSNPPTRQVIRLAGEECARRDPDARIPSASTATAG